MLWSTAYNVSRKKRCSSLHPYFDFVEIPVYCPENYRLYNGRCFGVHDNDLNFTLAEKQCNKLPGGHLAAFRSQEELDFIKNL